MPGLYLGGLIVAIVAMVLLDARYRLFFWRGPLRAAAVLVIGLLFFLGWDLVGVRSGVFFQGGGPFLIGADIAPQVPVEEVFFLTLLCYVTMNLIGMVDAIARRSRTAKESRR
ncbi:lycopene cyclase domain-containing protein [Curtobacterium ammoniigenes]|uniref:lycopene cyclase domain-containing protein n=1 Tax=Curtobacterium ammoniigenes TaxID=395387 RepID=UPI000831BFE8|nr:lycopene cyclase domain-containing protein [Curtobacterium ammoniigenes]